MIFQSVHAAHALVLAEVPVAAVKKQRRVSLTSVVVPSVNSTSLIVTSFLARPETFEPALKTMKSGGLAWDRFAFGMPLAFSSAAGIR